MAESTTYRVTWHVIGHPGEIHESRVQVIDGYTTTDDIPKIIATARTGRPSDAGYIVIDSQMREFTP